MSWMVTDNPDQFSHRKSLFLVLSAIIFSLGLSIFYSLGVLPLEGVCLFVVLPFLLLLFLIRQEATLFAIVAAYFGAGYFFPDLLTQGLMRGALLFLIGLMLILRSGAERTITRITTPLDKMIFLWLGVIFISFFYGFYFKGNETRYLIGDLYKFVEIISIFWLTTLIVKNRRQVRFLIWGFLLIVLVLGAIDSIIFFTRASLIGGALGARVRAGAQFSSIFALIMSVTLMLYEKRRKVKIILMLLNLYFFLSFLLCFLRTGYIALPLTLIFLVFLYFYKEKRHSLRGVAKFLLLVFVLLLFIGLFNMMLTRVNPDVNIIKATITRFYSLIDPREGSPMGVRTFEIKSIISQILMKNPLLGNGLGGQYYSFDDSPEGWKWGIKHYVHNNYFDFIIRTGMIGLIVFTLLAFRYLKDAIGFYLKSKNEVYKGFLLGFIGIFVSSCIIAFSCSMFYSPVLFMIMAMTYCVARFEKKGNE